MKSGQSKKSIVFAALTSVLALSACSDYALTRTIHNDDPPAGVMASKQAERYHDFLVGTLAGRDDRHVEAVSSFFRTLQRDPHSKLVSERTFMELLQSGQYDEAARLSRTIVKRSDGAVQDLIGLTYQIDLLARGEAEELLEFRARAGKGPFGYVLGPLIDAWGHAAAGNREGAEQALARIGGNALFEELSRTHKAMLLDYMGFSGDAESEYRILASNRVNNLQGLVAYGDFLYRNDRREEGRTLFRDSLQTYGNNVYLYRAATRLMGGVGLSVKPASPTGALALFFNQLASELGQGRSTSVAAIYAHLGVMAAPEYDNGWILLADLQEKNERYEAAASTLEAVAETSPLYTIAQFRRIEALRLAEQYEKAREQVTAMLDRSPDRSELMVTMGDLFRSEARYREALFWYSQAMEKRPNLTRQDWYLVFAHAVCNFELGEWASAEAGMLRALQLNPDEPSVLNYLGYSWIDKGVRQEEATEMIRKAVELKPDDGFILDSYGWAYFLTGEFEKAAVQLEKAVKLEPEDVTINEHLGDAYWKLGRRNEARFQWHYALQSNPTDEERPSLEGKLAYGLDVWEQDQADKKEQ